jgi:hypothetical protein
VKPNFHVFFPSSNARNSLGWDGVSCSMRVRTDLAIVSLLLENSVSEGA